MNHLVNSDRVINNVIGVPEETIFNFQRRVKISLVTGCWEWTGAKGKKGYGNVGTSPYFHQGKTTRAHQLSWLLYNGEIPDGLWVLHSCDNTSCCNPDHLFLGTQATNVKDMCEKGRQRGPRGEKAHLCNTKEEEVKKIRELHKTGMSYIKIAENVGVTKSKVNHILNGRCWKWLK